MAALNSIPSIGEKTLEKLAKLDIHTPKDLLYHFPSRYIDFSNVTKIAKVSINSNVTITGKILSVSNIYTRTRKNIQKAIVSDSTGQISLVWFNQPYLLKNIKAGDTLSFAGSVSFFGKEKTIISPEYGAYHTGKIIANYPETKGLSSKWFRKTIQTQLSNLTNLISDPLPQTIIKKYELLPLKQALTEVHTPKNSSILNRARLRLATDEILSLLASSAIQKKRWSIKTPSVIFQNSKEIDLKISKFIKSLPFKLTSSQKKAWQEIRNDLLSQNHVTNRLLCGDVGSGKTIVAALACYFAHLNQSTSLVLAPTTILSQQHFKNFKNLFKKNKVPIFSLNSKSKLNISKIPKGSIIISTHSAIYQKKTLSNKISLLIIDEQHKFGVKQRSFLSKLKHPPHCLTISATPIPRTIGLTMLGNLDLSTIDVVPQNRPHIKTFLVPPSKRSNCYDWIEEQIRATKVQAFIVCPFIDISETLTSVKSAIKEFDYLSTKIFPHLKLALIHGKLKQAEKNEIIKKFSANKINILVTTPIIEVGIDIPNSTIIIIQSADRFGLAQLHQLRGRVGRGAIQSHCFLFTDSENEKALNRLKFLQNNHNGFDIAAYDLKIRGPGEAFSTLQHGFPSLKIASFSNLKLISFAQKILKDIIQHNPKFNLNFFTSVSTAASELSN